MDEQKVQEKEHWMRLAIEEAKKAHDLEEVPIGAIVVLDNEIIGRGYNLRETTQDATTHAEMIAIREACQTLKKTTLAGCDLYASTEPCPMCMSAIYLTRMRAVYFSTPSNANQDYVYNQLSLKHDDRDIQMTQLTP